MQFALLLPFNVSFMSCEFALDYFCKQVTKHAWAAYFEYDLGKDLKSKTVNRVKVKRCIRTAGNSLALFTSHDCTTYRDGEPMRTLARWLELMVSWQESGQRFWCNVDAD